MKRLTRLQRLVQSSWTVPRMRVCRDTHRLDTLELALDVFVACRRASLTEKASALLSEVADRKPWLMDHALVAARVLADKEDA